MNGSAAAPNTPRLVLLTAALALLHLAAHAGDSAGSYLTEPDDWFRNEEGRRITGNVLSHQSPSGSWPKNTATAARPYTGDPGKLRGTFDNGATTGELRFLARAFNATKEARCEKAFLKGFDHILQAQYPTGGWPQFYPPDANYHRHVTFNDDTMKRLMEFLRDTATAKEFAFVDEARRQAARAAFDRGIECILKCQIKVNGQLAAWCAQHDEKTFEPRPARTYELVSLSGAESAGLLQLLMSLEKPGPEVLRAVHAGARWFESARLTGLRQEKVNGDKKIIRDPKAPPLWARFYEIETNRPIFSGRDGVKKYDIAEIEPERRNGYAWYGSWGEAVARRYAKWKESHPR